MQLINEFFNLMTLIKMGVVVFFTVTLSVLAKGLASIVVYCLTISLA